MGNGNCEKGTIIRGQREACEAESPISSVIPTRRRVNADDKSDNRAGGAKEEKTGEGRSEPRAKPRKVRRVLAGGEHANVIMHSGAWRPALYTGAAPIQPLGTFRRPRAYTLRHHRPPLPPPIAFSCSYVYCARLSSKREFPRVN